MINWGHQAENLFELSTCMYMLHCRELTILGRERKLQLYKSKIAITEIKAVKLCRNHNSKNFYLNNWPHTFLKSWTIFYNVESICFQLE